MEIKVTRKDLMYQYLLWLDPVFKLKEQERKVLSGYLTLHYYSRHRFSDLSILDEFLFSDPEAKTKNHLMKMYNLTEEKFNKIFTTLKNKGFLQEYTVQHGESTKNLFRLNPYITRYPKNEEFKINIELKVQ
jgi:hypothetical protein